MREGEGMCLQTHCPSVVQSLIAEPWICREIRCVKVTHMDAPESADAVLILFHWSDIPLPSMSAQSAGL